MNAHGQPVGLPVAGPLPRPRPPHVVLGGRHGRLSPLRAAHAPALFAAFAEDRTGRDRTYLSIEPWQTEDEAQRWCLWAQGSADPQFYAIEDGVGAAGICSLMRIAPEAGCVELGYIQFSPRLQRTRLATEAMLLILSHVFDTLGYRRCEWKCDALNAPSRRAAERLGFGYEGTFRQATVYKGRNRDTAWFSLLDGEWPERKARLERWLAASNFDALGRQNRRLSEV
ncbi:GNAT family N-acetyltransferase [Sagittula salina]|nr:GNAT family protein [Sagittula salina]